MSQSSTLDQAISPFIDSQFPDFYQQNGPNFIAFIKAYYEWLEQPDNVIGYSRSLPDIMDIDRTQQQFITHFKSKYIHSLPEAIISNKVLLVKHILDLYRSKGSQRSYELLFRLLFNEDIQIYIPNNFLFKPSAGTWNVPKYVEVSYSPYLQNLVGNQIYNSSGTASAVVENFYQKNQAGKIINILYISSEQGRFKYGEYILSNQVPQITLSNAPSVTGSLSSVVVNSGGYGFSVGDIVDVIGSGSGGKAKVISTQNQNGKVIFNLLNGGQGYSTNAVVTVATTLNILISNTSGTFNVSDTLTDSNTSANGTVVFANSSLLQIINYSNTNFNKYDVVTNGNATATIVSTVGGSGSGASFSIGAITNQQVYNLNTDYISNNSANSLGLSLDIGSASNTFVISFSGNTGAFSGAGNTVYSSTNTVILDNLSVSSNVVSVGESLSNTTLGISGLFVYMSEPNLVGVTGTDANLTNSNLAPGVILNSNTSSSKLQVVNVFPKTTITGNGIITSITGSGPYSVGVSFPTGNVNGYFIASGSLIDSTTARTANILSVTRTDNWAYFQPSGNQNLDSLISNELTYISLVAGTITYLNNLNPGSGYATNPYVSITEPRIAALNISDGSGGILGTDAVVTGTATSANGIMTSVSVIDSGYGYFPGETVYLQSENVLNQSSSSGNILIDLDGSGTGSWTDNKSFVSDINYLQDNYFYQQYSYQIIAHRMMSTYEQFVRDLIHPSGIALFGKYSLNSMFTNNASVPVEFVISQNNTTILDTNL